MVKLIATPAAVSVLLLLAWMQMKYLELVDTVFASRDDDMYRPEPMNNITELSPEDSEFLDSRIAPPPREHYYGLAMVGAFNHKKDPQHPRRQQSNNFKYIAPWYDSLHKASPDISGVVIENMFDEAFKANYTTKQVSFVTFNSSTHPIFTTIKDGKERGINDQLYFAFEWYLNETYGDDDENQGEKNSTAAKNSTTTTDLPEYVLLSDSHDVELWRNPFEYMRTMDQVMGGEKQLYVGDEWAPNREHMDNVIWKGCYKRNFPWGNTPIYNSGIIGGHVTVVRKVLREINKLFLRLNPSANCNMAVLEKVVHDHWKSNVVSGYPFHSKFALYEDSNTSNAYIRHK